MRRTDREMDAAFAKEVIDRAHYGVLSLSEPDGGTPYSIPLSLVRNGDALYFHCAKDGHKIPLLAPGTPVRVVFVGDVRVPDPYSDQELSELVRNPKTRPKVLGDVFTTEFESAIATGPVTEVTDPVERTEAFRALCRRFTPGRMAYCDLAIESGGAKARIFRIDMKAISGKRKRAEGRNG